MPKEPKIIFDKKLKITEIKPNKIKSSLIIPDYIKNKIDQKWQEMEITAKEKEATLFNGQTYRLESIKKTNNEYTLNVSLINFKERRCLEYLEKESDLGDISSNGLAIGGFLKTLEGDYIFGALTGKSFNHNKADFIGGIVDSRIELTSAGLWNKFLEEIEEETGLNAKHISDGIYLGIIKTQVDNCVLLCSAKIQLTKLEITKIFNTSLDHEMKGLEFVSATDLENYLNKLGGYKPAAFKLLDYHTI